MFDARILATTTTKQQTTERQRGEIKLFFLKYSFTSSKTRVPSCPRRQSQLPHQQLGRWQVQGQAKQRSGRLFHAQTRRMRRSQTASEAMSVRLFFFSFFEYFQAYACIAEQKGLDVLCKSLFVSSTSCPSRGAFEPSVELGRPRNSRVEWKGLCLELAKVVLGVFDIKQLVGVDTDFALEVAENLGGLEDIVPLDVVARWSTLKKRLTKKKSLCTNRFKKTLARGLSSGAVYSLLTYWST